MEQKISWRDIQRRYPDQWVSLCDIDRADDGSITAGVVIAAGPDLADVALESKGHASVSHQFKYTGEIKNFIGFSKWTIDDVPAR